MRTLPVALQDHLASGTTTLCQCWRLIRRDGIVMGFTDHDRELSFGGTSFSPHGGFDGSALEQTADLAVDNSEITGVLNHPDLSQDDIIAGRFDEAEVEVWRVNWRNPAARVLISTGVIGEIRHGALGFSAEIRGLSHFLDQTVGRLYQRQCDANVGDARCGVDLNLEQFTGDGTVIVLTDENAVTVSGLASFATDWFVEGMLIWTSGKNLGVAGFIKSFATGSTQQSLSLWQPPAFAPIAGDQFTVTAGCNRRFETCRDKFSNAINYRGFHLMPGNDFVVSYPLRRERNDGGKR